MATYVVTGVSRGIGYALLTELTKDSKNTVIGLVRDTAGTLKKISEDSQMKGRSNFHIVEGDLTNYESLKKAASETSTITGGAIDYLIGNAGYVPKYDAYDPIGYLSSTNPKRTEEELRKCFDINVVGQIHLITLFLPLILKGKTKKIVSVTSGLADLDFTNAFDIFTGSLYSLSKAAMNMAMAKFSAQYKQDGVLFLSVCPGMVDVGHYAESTPEELEKLGGLMAKFTKYKPDFSGPVSPETSVRDMKAVWEKTSVENGDGGAFLSQYGNKQWL
ncbi:hypothetical protein GGS26DRAFT_559334 [Hypomontagnella submonticulosa]|nr:hypothetical protein GGS26DRAFT_559334 [Hypomontagnella submonticulosa]